jgi:hypothetical protein
VKRAATGLQYLTLFLATWFIASPDHPIAVAAAAALTAATSLLLLTVTRRKNEER